MLTIKYKSAPYLYPEMSSFVTTFGGVVVDTVPNRERLLSLCRDHSKSYQIYSETSTLGHKHLHVFCSLTMKKRLRTLTSLVPTIRIERIRDVRAFLLYISKHQSLVEEKNMAPYISACVSDGGSAYTRATKNKMTKHELLTKALETGSYDSAIDFVKSYDRGYWTINADKIKKSFREEFPLVMNTINTSVAVKKFNPLLKSRLRDDLTNWVYGSTGIGKTQWINHIYPDAVTVSQSSHFEMLSGDNSSVIILDDFEFSTWDTQMFKNYLDNNIKSKVIHCRYSDVCLTDATFVVVDQLHPIDRIRGMRPEMADEDVKAIVRRLNVVNLEHRTYV